MIVEVDGGQHGGQSIKDEARDKWLVSQGFRVLRFWNNDVLRETDIVVETIVQALKSTPTLALPRKGGGNKGFTLIEVVVVISIIVIILAIVSANLEPNRETVVRDEANRLALLVQTAQQEAILQGKVLAVAFEREGYSFLVLTMDEKHEFKPLADDDVLRARPLPPNVIISSVDIEGAPESGATLLVLSPTGELPPFTITLSHGDTRWQVRGTFAGEITAVSPAAAPEKA